MADGAMILADLFCGCGGFSLGAHDAGFHVKVAVDNDPILASSYCYNFPKTRFLLKDISLLDGSALRAEAGGKIDGVFGGPPCQGFSDIGRRRADDPRRALLMHFFRIVSEIQPTFFVMENVRGLAYPDARSTLDEALQMVAPDYALMGPVILDASDFGAATKRARLFVIGIRNDCGTALTPDELGAWRRPAATVRAAISDIQRAVSEGQAQGFDIWRIAGAGAVSQYARGLRAPDNRFSGHKATLHSGEVVARFNQVPQGGKDPVGRHPRLAWSGQCPTLRAGTGADRGSYQSVRPIHPEVPRVITVREAARLQGFPDKHRFHPTVWHSFRMVGNSVSPVISRAIFSALSAKLWPQRQPAELAAE
jgi:DNA (cytosine-5)-methyltransferase 1